MRKLWILASVAAIGLVGMAAQAAEPSCAPCNSACETCNSCDTCACRGGLLGRHGQGHGHHCKQQYEGRYPGFHCGCNGSYKFPVPPLYTYHWPGMYSAQLMTDYHSPWRFPPLKPYTDELPIVEMGMNEDSLQAVPVATTARVVGEIEPMSSRLLRMQR